MACRQIGHSLTLNAQLQHRLLLVDAAVHLVATGIECNI